MYKRVEITHKVFYLFSLEKSQSVCNGFQHIHQININSQQIMGSADSQMLSKL